MKRIFQGLFTAAGVALLTFLALRVVPGDPVELMLGESSQFADRELMRQKLGLDLSLGRQFLTFVTGLTHGDLGSSIVTGRPVTATISAAIPHTFSLALAIALFANLIGIPLGVIAAFRSAKISGQVLFYVTALLIAVPSFWLAPVLILAFGLHWPWLPITRSGELGHYVLPVLASGIGLSAYFMQTTRAAISECLQQDYVRTAIGKGASTMRVLFVHALPNAAIPLITVSALQFGYLLSGSVIIETIFEWPGLGKLTKDAIQSRDYPIVQGAVLVIALIYVTLNTITDLLNTWLRSKRS